MQTFTKCILVIDDNYEMMSVERGLDELCEGEFDKFGSIKNCFEFYSKQNNCFVYDKMDSICFDFFESEVKYAFLKS